MADKAEEPLWVFIYPYGVTLACVCIHTCYRPLTIAFALLALNCDQRIEKQRVVDTSNPAISKIFQHSCGNTVFAQMRHLGTASSYGNSKTKRPVA